MTPQEVARNLTRLVPDRRASHVPSIRKGSRCEVRLQGIVAHGTILGGLTAPTRTVAIVRLDGTGQEVFVPEGLLYKEAT